MALQEVCGFQEIALCSDLNQAASLSISFHDTTLSTYPAGRVKTTWREPFEKHGGSPLHLLLPPQHSLGRSRHSSHFSTSWPAVPCPFALTHGTTTLGFTFQGGVIAAADTRASAGGLIACPAAQKVIPIHSHMVVTTSGSGADCMLWERILTREIRLYQLRHGRRLSVAGAAKLLSFMLHPFKGTEVCVAVTLCGWDGEDPRAASKTVQDPSLTDESSSSSSNAGSGSTFDLNASKSETLVPPPSTDGISSEKASESALGPHSGTGCHSGPRVCYVCSDGLVLKGELISVGSGSPYAYSVLDGGWRWSMSVDEAVALAREAVYRATHRDAYSGNNVDLFHITERGWSRRRREDLKDEYHRKKTREKEMMQQKARRRASKHMHLLRTEVEAEVTE